MGFRGHAFVTLMFFVIIAVFGRMIGLNWGMLFQGAIFMLLGGLFPDIDTTGRGRRFFYLIIFSAAFWCWVVSAHILAGLLITSAILPVLVNHRGLFHNLYFLAALTLLFSWTGYVFVPWFPWAIFANALFFLIGCWVHLVVDFGLRSSFDART